MKIASLLLSAFILLALTVPGVANDRCYYESGAGYRSDNDRDDSGNPGLTAAERDAFGPSAVESETAMRDNGGMYGSSNMRPMRMSGSPQAQWQFRNAMTKLWEDHITYTRNFIVAAAAGSQSTDAIVARLMQNQVDIGDAIKPYYGSEAGNQLTALLKQHIAIAGEIVTDAKAGKTDAMADANKRWFANADQLAAFLSSANPNNWPQAAVQGMLHEHLNLTTQEAKAELTGDWDGSIAAYDQVHQAMLKMSGALADGIIAQFPDRF